MSALDLLTLVTALICAGVAIYAFIEGNPLLGSVNAALSLMNFAFFFAKVTA